MKTSLRFFIFFILLTGIAYPLLIAGIGNLFFPHQAAGSLVIKNDQIIGSELIGQKFSDNRYFSPRPSAIDYNSMPSGGSNLAPTSAKLADNLKQSLVALKKSSGLPATTSIPSDLLFASASGLDPHISPEAARFQIERVKTARHLNENQTQKLKNLLDRLTEQPSLGFIGKARVNVLQLNLALDENF